jgi:uncharacterized protein YrrD
LKKRSYLSCDVNLIVPVFIIHYIFRLLVTCKCIFLILPRHQKFNITFFFSYDEISIFFYISRKKSFIVEKTIFKKLFATNQLIPPFRHNSFQKQQMSMDRSETFPDNQDGDVLSFVWGIYYFLNIGSFIFFFLCI